MNSCFLHHAWGLYPHKCLREEYKSNTIILHIESKQAPKCGPQCGHAHLVKNGFRTRDFINLPIGGKKVILRMKVAATSVSVRIVTMIAGNGQPLPRAVTATLVALQSRMNPIFSLCGEASAGVALQPKF